MLFRGIKLIVVFAIFCGFLTGTHCQKSLKKKGRQVKRPVSLVYPASDPSNVNSPPSDPTDLSGQLNVQCQSDSTMLNLESLFSSLFMNDTEADEFVSSEKQRLNSPQRKSTKYIHNNRETKLIGTISTFGAAGADACCVTESKVTSPESVMVNGRSMPLVRLSTGYQFIEQGECLLPGSTCRQTGTCVQQFKKMFVLVYNSALRMSPPVNFEMIDVPSHCECLNVGA